MAEATHERILDAAEHRFAEHGFAGTSMRAVTSDAGVNLAAVSYHFGSKEALFHAVVSRCVEPVNQERLKRLDRLEAAVAAAPPAVEAILEAYIAPVLDPERLSTAGRRIAGRLYAEPAALVNPILKREFGEPFRRYVAVLGLALPGLSRQALEWRLQFAVGAALHLMTHAGRVGALVGSEPPDLVGDLVRFCAAGMRSC